jgi:aminoglycoside phosphotransferase (APT) family kinase protein
MGLLEGDAIPDRKLGRKIGEGGCAEVYEWEDGSKVIKLAKSNTSAYELSIELRNNQAVWEQGLPVPRPYGLVDVAGRPGAIFERIAGESMMERFTAKLMQPKQQDQSEGNAWDWDPDMRADIAKMAELMHSIHQHAVPGLPSQMDEMMNRIRHGHCLNDGEKETVIERLKQLPQKERLCHGDLNPGNIMIRDGEYVVIDWMNATTGTPEADIAEYIVMIRYGVLPPELPESAIAVFDAVREAFIQLFMEVYTQISGMTYAEIEPWLVPVAARKLSTDAIGAKEKQILTAAIRRQIGS